MAGRQKLELTWIGKDQRRRLEPRTRMEDPARSCHATQRVTEIALLINSRLIKCDNLSAFKALEPNWAGDCESVAGWRQMRQLWQGTLERIV